jgi:hypothetical protein
MSQNYNLTLQSNNTNLQAILDSINELPEASDGGESNTEIEDSIVNKTITSYSNNRVTTIGSYVFEDCSSLTEISIGKNIQSIGYTSFGSCKNLQIVYYYGPNEIKYSNNIFGSSTQTENAILYTTPSYTNTTFCGATFKEIRKEL